jgi:hypothetical protein
VSIPSGGTAVLCPYSEETVCCVPTTTNRLNPNIWFSTNSWTRANDWTNSLNIFSIASIVNNWVAAVQDWKPRAWYSNCVLNLTSKQPDIRSSSLEIVCLIFHSLPIFELLRQFWQQRHQLAILTNACKADRQFNINPSELLQSAPCRTVCRSLRALKFEGVREAKLSCRESPWCRHRHNSIFFQNFCIVCY